MLLHNKYRWCDVTVLNAHAWTEDERDDWKDSLSEELEQVVYFKTHS